MSERRKPIHLPPKSCEISGRSLLGNEDKMSITTKDILQGIVSYKDEDLVKRWYSKEEVLDILQLACSCGHYHVCQNVVCEACKLRSRISKSDV